MKIKLRGDMFPALRNGKKTRTSRFGKRDIKVGEKAVFVMTENEKIKQPVEVTGVYYCKYFELTEDEAKKEGYSSLEELKTALDKIYHPEPNDDFTIIEFKKIGWNEK